MTLTCRCPPPVIATPLSDSPRFWPATPLKVNDVPNPYSDDEMFTAAPSTTRSGVGFSAIVIVVIAPYPGIASTVYVPVTGKLGT